MSKAQFIIAATRSGSGKTLLTLGLLAALRRRGLRIAPFKCGPDFIDPSLHRMITGQTSFNLDLFMMGEDGCRATFKTYSADSEVILVEGVMGLFDGGTSSTAALSLALDLPVILIVDVRSAAESVAAVIKGFELYDPAVRLAGVILNQVGSARHRQLIGDAIAASCQVEVLGYFPRQAEFELPSRHLGLHMGDEIALSAAETATLAEAVESHLDLDRLLAITAITPAPIAGKSVTVQSALKADGPRLAVARDQAFCFYYQENLDLLAAAGITIVPFSPLTDPALPADIAGIYLGGGYPELHAADLCNNTAMRRAISDFCQAGGLVYSECGGFMYLTERLIDLTGQSFDMVGVFPLVVRMKPKLARLGYRQVSLRQDCLLGRAGEIRYGHEFHYSDIVETADDQSAEPRPMPSQAYNLADGRPDGYIHKRTIGSYIHLHFGGTAAAIHHWADELHLVPRSSQRI